MAVFDSGVFDSGTFDGQPANQISGVGFDASAFGAHNLGSIVATGAQHDALGSPSVAATINPAGWVDTLFGDNNAQWPQDITATGIYEDAAFGLTAAHNTGEPDTPQTVTVPYFSGFTGPLQHVYHLIGGDVTVGMQTLFGNLTHRTWIFSVGQTDSWGTTQLGRPITPLIENDTRFPLFNSLVYAFGQADPPEIYCFGFTTGWTAPRMKHVVSAPETLPMTFGTTQAGAAAQPLQIFSTRFPSTHSTLKFPFGYSPFVEPDTFIGTLYGTPTMMHAVTEITALANEGMGAVQVTRYAPPALRLRDFKNTTLKFDGVPFEFGYPKRDIFVVGIKPAGFGPDIKLPRVMYPSGIQPASMYHWYWPELQNRNQTVQWPYSGYAWRSPGAGGTVPQPALSNQNHVGLYLRGWDSATFLGTSVYNVRQGISPAVGSLTVFGTASITNTQKTIHAWGWAPYLESVSRVWHVAPQTIGPVGNLSQLASGYVQCVLLDPDFYSMQSFKVDGYGLPTVKREFNARPIGFDTLWGAMQVTHYTRSIFPWQPWKDTIIGGVSAIKHRYHVYPDGFAGTTQFGDAHRWEENLIRLRPWTTGALGAVRTRMEVIFSNRIHDAYVDDGRVGSPTAVHALAATTQQVDASLGDQLWVGLDVARFTTGACPVQGISIAPDGYGTAQVNRTAPVEGFASGAFANPAALRPAVPYTIDSYVGTPSMLVPFYPYAFWSTEMGHVPSVCYGTAFQCCGMLPRAMVPKGFAKEQFGDFDALV